MVIGDSARHARVREAALADLSLPPIRRAWMAQMLKFDDAAARRLQVAYMTPDVVAQREQTLAALAVHPGEKVVDIGTGPGYLAASIARAVGENGKVVAVDSSENMLAVARASCADFPWVEFRAAD